MGSAVGLRDALRELVLPGTVALTAVVFDVVDRRTPFSVVATGLLDEPAHVAFTALALLVVCLFVRLPRRFWVSALLAAALIDLDHVPLYLGMSSVAVQPGGRPLSHSLSTVALLLLCAAVWRRQRVVLIGAAVGVFLHLVRDVVEGPPGVALLWPVTDHEWSMSGPAFVVLVVALLLARLVMVTAVRSRRAADEPRSAPAARPGGPRSRPTP